MKTMPASRGGMNNFAMIEEDASSEPRLDIVSSFNSPRGSNGSVMDKGADWVVKFSLLSSPRREESSAQHIAARIAIQNIGLSHMVPRMSLVSAFNLRPKSLVVSSVTMASVNGDKDAGDQDQTLKMKPITIVIGGSVRLGNQHF
ncbi:unnamed protein product [Cyprideis torosa]|uniref:Uncharacterized protein n=1 Tax=Cyprideis torosa TaxID=163714 RepID=A0A7R8WM41_9CRUS|nr:unnamed protein product [Cyprideis torosa]CAG0904938.1 unnamed protein product [Cyprideis torosa]